MRLEERLHQLLIERRMTLAIAESCTGGAIAARLTAMADASNYLRGSLVVYCEEWKRQFLGVKRETLEKEGAVSLATAREMAEGLFRVTKTDCVIAVTGIAGPSGGTDKIPVGTIYIAVGVRGSIDAGVIHAPNRRAEAIEMAVQSALEALYRKLNQM